MRLRNANVVKWAFWEFLLNACHTVMYYIIVVGKRPNILSIPGLQKIDFLSHTKKKHLSTHHQRDAWLRGISSAQRWSSLASRAELSFG